MENISQKGVNCMRRQRRSGSKTKHRVSDIEQSGRAVYGISNGGNMEKYNKKLKFKIRCIYEPRGEQGLEGFSLNTVYDVLYRNSRFLIYKTGKDHQKDFYIGTAYSVRTMNKYFDVIDNETEEFRKFSKQYIESMFKD